MKTVDLSAIQRDKKTGFGGTYTVYSVALHNEMLVIGYSHVKHNNACLVTVKIARQEH